MTVHANNYICFTCGSSFQFGPHIYNGEHIGAYGITVCKGCFQGNHDGWGPIHAGKIVAHLTAKGIPIPAMNSEGYLPRGKWDAL